MANPSRQTANLGFSLAEMLLFIVVVSIAFATMVPVFTRTSRESVTPVEQIRAVKLAQSKLDEILALKFDENSPSGGIPACGSTTGVHARGSPRIRTTTMWVTSTASPIVPPIRPT